MFKESLPGRRNRDLSLYISMSMISPLSIATPTGSTSGVYLSSAQGIPSMEKPNSLETSKEEEFPNLICDICIEPMTHKKKFNNNKRCAHPFCIDCIAKYIAAKVEERVAQVPCPALNCKKLLYPLSCRRILPSGLFVKWCGLICESAVLRGESAYCPFADCSALILNECGRNVTKSECPNCKRLMCFRCKLPWHAGFGCDETGDMRDENDVLFGQVVERNKWKRCPGCKYSVERNEGCQNIKCRCGVLFCYTCGKVKHACECYRWNIGVEEGHMRRRNRLNRDYFCRWIIRTIFFIISNSTFIGLIVELLMMKGDRVAHIFAGIILILYIDVAAPFLLSWCFPMCE